MNADHPADHAVAGFFTRGGDDGHTRAGLLGGGQRALRPPVTATPCTTPSVTSPAGATVHRLLARPPQAVAERSLAAPAHAPGSCRVSDMLALLLHCVPVQRRLLHAGDAAYEAGGAFVQLHVVNAGCFKIVDTSADGRDQIVGLQFRGDWLGFDGLASGRHACDALALDTGEVWTMRYDTLLQAATGHPPLMLELHTQMGRAITQARGSVMSLCCLPSVARVADFLRKWAVAVAGPGQGADRFTLPMSRAEIGNHLGMTIESVSRAMSQLVRSGVIRFTDKGRHDVVIPDPAALAAFIDGEAVAGAALVG